MSDDRRQFQRLSLSRALDGWFGDFAVRLVDVSATGALIEYADDIPFDARALLRFFWQDEEVEIMCEIVRHGDTESGLHFLESNSAIKRLIAHSAAEVLRAQYANAIGDREANRVGDQTLTSASEGVNARAVPFVVCTLEENGWVRRPAMLPDQPLNGFTVGVHEPAEDIQLLCTTYETGNREARRLTRLFAELSVAGAR